MPTSKQITFGRFRLDLTNECLWQGTQAITLRPKAYAVLKHLLDHAGQLVTKQQLLDAVWPGTFVGDAVLKSTVRQLREALADDAEAPEYIQTAHRRGYRFVGRIDEAAPEQPRPPGFGGAEIHPPASPAWQVVLGRDSEAAKLQGWLQRALGGERQVAFVTGEAGIGKTTLVNALLDSASAIPGIAMGRGQCLEQYGSGEAYLPVLDALSRLGRGAAGERVVDALRRFAPAWLLELRTLLPHEEREQAPTTYPRGATRERMLREIAEAIEAMTIESPVVMVLEDLHWSDYSTLDLIAYLARRTERARLMLIGTYRPVDVILGEHPLKSVKRELQAHNLCHELPLEYLTEDAVAQFLDVKLPGHQLGGRLARLVHRRTEGNPLFIVNLVEYLIDEGALSRVNGDWQLLGAEAAIDSGIPDNVRHLIEKQIDRLSPDERTVLEGASVVGMECSSLAIAAGLERSLEWVDEHCEALVRRHRFLSPARIVTLPDGTVTARYKFSHILYLDVPYRLLPAMRRGQIHGRIGTSGESVYGSRVGEIAAELAMHFEQARDHPRAVKYLLQAGENARHHSAHHEAEALARRGLQQIELLPPGLERDQQELALRLILGVAVMAIKGFAAAEVKDIFKPALELSARAKTLSHAFMVRWLLGLYHYFRAELKAAREVTGGLLQQAGEVGDPLMIIEAHRASGVTLVELGQSQDALGHLDMVSALYDPDRYRTHVPFGGQDPQVVSDCFAARALWMSGHPDQALRRIERAVALAQSIGHVESLVIAMHFAAHIHQLRGEAARCEERAEAVIAMSAEYGLAVWIAFGRMNRGWARIARGQGSDGIQELRQGLAAYDSTGARLWKSYFQALLAQALAREGLERDAAEELAQALALAAETGECWSLPELWRVQGELLTGQKDAQAESALRQAIAIAREQRARSWELRALTSLWQLADRRTRHDKDRKAFEETYAWFSEGHDTADLRAARTLLNGV